MKPRTSTIERKTTETDISLKLNLDGTGRYEIDTGIGFFDHMLAHLAKHGKMDLTLKAKGDLHVDAHHTVEDVAICLGQALCEALGDKKGIGRFADSVVPMEDAKAQATIDLSGRPYLIYRAKYNTQKIGDFDIECIEEFLRAFSTSGKFNLHIDVPYGINSHHIAEAIFKALGQSMAAAVKIVGGDIPSTKGIL
jgi:imidazoleglycerol-phosphate dehydratase